MSLSSKTDFSGSADRLFLRSDSGRAGSTNPRQKAGRGQCQPHLYGSVVWIYGAFGDFQKYAPLADLSGGRICTLLCFLSGLEQKETSVEQLLQWRDVKLCTGSRVRICEKTVPRVGVFEI